MRTIKFRAWNKNKQVMQYNPPFGLAEHTDNYFKDNRVFEFMQFTGLLDKNGKEIYEGDLIKYSIQGDTQSEPMEVKIPDIFIELGHDDNYYKPQPDSFEIIGNIYENPDLLK